MSPAILLFCYVGLLLVGLGAVAVFYDVRRKRFEPSPTADRIFRCSQCSLVYTDDADVDRSRCPQCRTPNPPIRF